MGKLVFTKWGGENPAPKVRDGPGILSKNRSGLDLVVLLTFLLGLFGLLHPAWPADEQAAPDFTLPSLNGQQVALKDLRGQVVLINFWATWCGECVWELPELETLYQAYKDKGLSIVGVALDIKGAAIVRPFLNEEKIRLTYPILLDPEAEVAEKYLLRGIPVTMVVGRHGELIGPVYGSQYWSEKEPREFVEKLLIGEPPLSDEDQ